MQQIKFCYSNIVLKMQEDLELLAPPEFTSGETSSSIPRGNKIIFCQKLEPITPAFKGGGVIGSRTKGKKLNFNFNFKINFNFKNKREKCPLIPKFNFENLVNLKLRLKLKLKLRLNFLFMIFSYSRNFKAKSEDI